MSEVWKIALKTTVVFMICFGVLFLSSCGARNCDTHEFLTNSMCR